MSMTTNKQALRQTAEKAQEHGVFNMDIHSETLLALLDELERLDSRNAELNSTLARWATDRAESTSELEAAERRNAELEERPANPINFKENAGADYCRGWAWNEVKKELGTETWTVGDNCTYYGFFCWGWDSRRQYNEQRAAATDKGE